MINEQINLEFRASYIYLSMSAWFAGDNQALTGKWPIIDKWTVYVILENSSYTIHSSYVNSFIDTFLITVRPKNCGIGRLLDLRFDFIPQCTTLIVQCKQTYFLHKFIFKLLVKLLLHNNIKNTIDCFDVVFIIILKYLTNLNSMGIVITQNCKSLTSKIEFFHFQIIN